MTAIAPDDDPAAIRARIVALSGELADTRRELWVARARAAHPALPDGAVEFLTARDEPGIMRQAALLAALVEVSL